MARFNTVPTIPVNKKPLAFGFLFFVLLALLMWGYLNRILESSWQEEMYKPGIHDKLVILDPGHGGADSGAVLNGINESDINLAIAREVKAELEKMGAEVLLTREEEGALVPEQKMNHSQWMANLEGRKEFAVDKRGHIFISIHSNTNQSSQASGGIVYYTAANSLNEKLALEIQRELNSTWNKQREMQEKGFSVIMFETMPSALVEAGFLTNPQDMKVLSTEAGRKKIAAAVARGIKEYCDGLPKSEQ